MATAESSSPVEQESVQSSVRFSFSPLHKLQGLMALIARSIGHRETIAIIPEMASHYKFYEDAFVKKVKDELVIVLENPALAGGVALVSGLVLLRGPRRFLFRNTVGRFQSEESRIVKTESILKELGQSLDKLKKDSKNTILRASFGEEELLRGRTKIRNAGSEIQRLSRTIYKTESEAAGLMDALREMPGRNALKLRAEVASLAADLKEQRRVLDKRIMKIAELGIRV